MSVAANVEPPATPPQEAPELLTCAVEDDALVEVPIWEDHERGKNWLAVISADPRKPAGLARVWMPHGRGEYFYLVDTLKVGDPVEFGADYVSRGGSKTVLRWYGFVHSKSEDAVVFERCATAKAAIRAARSVRKAAALVEAEQAQAAKAREKAALRTLSKAAAQRARRIAALEKQYATLEAQLTRLARVLDAARADAKTSETRDEAV